MPSVKRPPQIALIVPAIFATSPGLRYVLPITRWPICNRCVNPATAATTDNPSNAGSGSCSRGPGGGTKWSANQTLFQRPASIVSTTPRMSLHCSGASPGCVRRPRMLR